MELFLMWKPVTNNKLISALFDLWESSYCFSQHFLLFFILSTGDKAKGWHGRSSNTRQQRIIWLERLDVKAVILILATLVAKSRGRFSVERDGRFIGEFGMIMDQKNPLQAITMIMGFIMVGLVQFIGPQLGLREPN